MLYHLSLWPDEAPSWVSVIDCLGDNNLKKNKKARNVRGRKRKCQTDPGSWLREAIFAHTWRFVNSTQGNKLDLREIATVLGVLLLLFYCFIILF